MSVERLGSQTKGTTFPDVIINVVEGTATNRVAGFAQIVHNPRELKTIVDTLAQQEIPLIFADAVLLRRSELQQINEIWDFPLSAAAPCTCPLPWTVLEAVEKAVTGIYSKEYNIMRTLDFIGRNILRFELPMINLITLANSVDFSTYGDAAENTYLGAWHRDLPARIINKISLYPRSSNHVLFEYTGYDIFIHNLIFGNERKEMNDLMAGEDRFELCYDPYRVDSSAMGLSSFKGLDVFSLYTTQVNGTQRDFTATGTTAIGPDSLVDLFMLDDQMDYGEFRDAYRSDNWYEAPIAQNYHTRHSIHSRRVVHYPKSIDVPLDILPFGYSIGSAISTAALAGECGFIRVELNEDWLDRCFYCTRLSDVPPAYKLPQHLHFQVGDTYDYVDVSGNVQTATIENDNAALPGWVNTRSLGRFGDAEFKRGNGTGENNFNTDNAYAIEGGVINKPVAHRAENVLQAKVSLQPNSAYAGSTGTVPVTTRKATLLGQSMRTGPTSIGNRTVVGGSKIQRTGNYQNASAYRSTSAVFAGTAAESLVAEAVDPVIFPLSMINPSFSQEISQKIKTRLFQIGFQTLMSVSELLTKLPNIYITTEWQDKTISLSNPNINSFRIDNDLYQMANVFWFIPTDANGIESLRYYACHKINHEMPIINSMTIKTQLDQGTCRYDWDMLNIVNPAYMGLNPLIENIGIMSFSPEIHANSFPLAYYDPNIAGQIDVNLEYGSGSEAAMIGTDQYPVNMKRGLLKVISVGVNGAVSVNLSLYRLVF